MRQLPTDLEILDEIYERYYDTFVSEKRSRISVPYVPIEICRIASALRIDGDIVFSRLHFFLDGKYKYQQSNEFWVHFFYLKFEERGKVDRHCINFPYMASVLAELRVERQRRRADVTLARIAIIVATLSALTSFLGLFVR